jgi:hypothetical protein
VTDAHQFLGLLATAATLGLLAAIGWSTWASRRSDGGVDHRFAVDRLALLVIVLIAANGLIGLVLVGVGARPTDPLHLLYGPAALVSLPVGVWLGRRGNQRRARRDAWVLATAIVLLGLELRLFMTG